MSLAMAASPSREAALSLQLRAGKAPAAAFEEMKKELAALMSAAGVAIRWENAASHGVVDGATVVVDLEGDCSAGFRAEMESAAKGIRIGSTATANGEILPFVNVNCGAIAGLIGLLMADRPVVWKELAFGRALGRVLAHELYHVLTQSGDHVNSGIAKANFSGADLIESRFVFDEVALARIRSARTAQSHAVSFVSPGGAALGDDIAEEK
jgi:hypothetical protein